jgi:hypothetical protein
MTNRTEWSRQYREKNRIKLNAYNREWMRNYRKLKPAPKRIKRKHYKSSKDFWIKDGHCQNCGILIPEGKFCEDCLKNPKGVLTDSENLARLV